MDIPNVSMGNFFFSTMNICFDRKNLVNFVLYIFLQTNSSRLEINAGPVDFVLTVDSN